MANQYMSMNTLRHLLYSVHDVEDLLKFDRFQDYDKEAFNIFLDSIKDFSDQELYPCFREMDEQPAVYDNGTIKVHPQIEKMMKMGGELGIIGGPFDYEDGGLQIPGIINQAAYFILDAANNNVGGYPGLTGGAAKLIATFGNQELKDAYLPNMLSGDWAGTMCLTEPQAGSSLSDITSTAQPQDDGSFKIKGQKIFISGGDHEYSDNIIHLVLARIDGAPAGTKGISLFVVPKYQLNTDKQSNDVITAGDFQKLGQRGYCTAHLVFGENDNCQGWLVGEPHRGLTYMFQMMNGARISVGRSGAAIAMAAYYASLQYANERPQGRRLQSSGKKDPNQSQTLIKNHADVRRMLLLQKAVAEGSLSLILQAALYLDLQSVAEGAEKEKNNILLEMLTPIVKTYPSEMGMAAVSNGLQILGGYGFCSEFVLQQYYRDVRILPIYEGTTGIQSQDLLGRKMTMMKGEGLKLLIGEMMEVIEAANTHDALKPYASTLSEQIELNQKVLGFLIPFAMKGDHERFLSDASLFMEFFSTIVIAWQWLKIAVAAQEALVVGNTEETPEFYESKIHTMKFFFKYEVPKTAGLAQSMMNEEILTIVEERELIS